MIKNRTSLPKTGIPPNVALKTDWQAERNRLRGALRTLYELLEEYSPSWYTKEHHKQAKAALDIKDTLCDHE